MTTKALQLVLADISERLSVLERLLRGEHKKLTREEAKKIAEETFGSMDKKRAKAMLASIEKSRNAWR